MEGNSTKVCKKYGKIRATKVWKTQTYYCTHIRCVPQLNIFHNILMSSFILILTRERETSMWQRNINQLTPGCNLTRINPQSLVYRTTFQSAEQPDQGQWILQCTKLSPHSCCTLQKLLSPCYHSLTVCWYNSDLSWEFNPTFLP